MINHARHWIGGDWIDGTAGDHLQSLNPATGDSMGIYVPGSVSQGLRDAPDPASAVISAATS